MTNMTVNNMTMPSIEMQAQSVNTSPPPKVTNMESSNTDTNKDPDANDSASKDDLLANAKTLGSNVDVTV